MPWGFPADQLEKARHHIDTSVLYRLLQNAKASAKFGKNFPAWVLKILQLYTDNRAPHISEDHNLILQLFDSSFLLRLEPCQMHGLSRCGCFYVSCQGRKRHSTSKVDRADWSTPHHASRFRERHVLSSSRPRLAFGITNHRNNPLAAKWALRSRLARLLCPFSTNAGD